MAKHSWDGSGQPAPTSRPAAPSSTSCGGHVAVCVLARLEEAAEWALAKCGWKDTSLQSDLDAPSTASFSCTTPAGECKCAHAHRQALTCPHVHTSRIPGSQGLWGTAPVPPRERRALARCQEKRPYSAAGTEVPFCNFHPPCALAGHWGTMLIGAAHSFILAWAGWAGSQPDLIQKQPGNGWAFLLLEKISRSSAADIISSPGQGRAQSAPFLPWPIFSDSVVREMHFRGCSVENNSKIPLQE